MKLILFYADNLERLYFFRRFIPACQKLEFQPIFITAKLSVHLLSKKAGLKTFLIKKYKSDQEADIDQSLEVLAGTYTRKTAQEMWIATTHLLEIQFDPNSIYCAFIWNGNKVADKAIKQWCNLNNVKTLFWEISNLPKKLQVDRKGTNAQSELFSNLQLLEKYNDSSSAFQKWKVKYIEKKKQDPIVPQSKHRTRINYYSFIDWLGSILGVTPKLNQITMHYRFSRKWKNRSFLLDLDYKDLSDEKYIFYPMQVRGDTQILLNSEFDNFDAIKYAAKIAREKGLALYIKPHPAELDSDYILQAKSLIDQYSRIYFVCNNTFELIKFAHSVITINSSVGLEAKLMQKQITCLGKAVYQKMDDKQLASYITQHLVNIDFFANKDLISEHTLLKVLERA